MAVYGERVNTCYSVLAVITISLFSVKKKKLPLHCGSFFLKHFHTSSHIKLKTLSDELALMVIIREEGKF